MRPTTRSMVCVQRCRRRRYRNSRYRRMVTPQSTDGAAGGVVNIITRSGTNDFHGDVFGYLRNRNFQATNPFSNVSNPAYTRVQAGTAFGGALKKDKTFYFFSYEVTRRHETGFSSIGSPNGNFGLVPFDASALFGAPDGTFPIQVTPEQADFCKSALCLYRRRKNTLSWRAALPVSL